MKAEGIALVTGAARGIGRAVALELAQRGFEVWASMRRVEAGAGLLAEARKQGLSLRVERLDVTQAGDFEFPDGLRVLVNNAGVRLQYLPVETASPEKWRQTFETNVFGLIEVTRRAIPKLRAAGGGVICNVTSASILGPLPFFGTYRSSKCAVSGLCETLRTELAPFGIRVVEILPGPIDTELSRDSCMYRLPEAAAVPAYREMALRNFPTLEKAPAMVVTSAADAARSIADAILDDQGPMRYGCDPMSNAMLDAWRNETDEVAMRGALARFLEPPAGRVAVVDRPVDGAHGE